MRHNLTDSVSAAAVLTGQQPAADRLGVQQYWQWLRTAVTRRPALWMLPIGTCVLIALMYGLFGPRTWQASQTFVVREQLIGLPLGAGRFQSSDSMKSAQETIQEIAKNPAVLQTTLKEVGPNWGTAPKNWPSEKTVEEFRKSVSFVAPNGAEFGQTEVLRLNVNAGSRDRARELVDVLFANLEKELRAARAKRAASMLAEQQQAVQVARDNLNQVSHQLQALETSVGSDLGELRSLNDPASGDSDLRRTLIQIRDELRTARADLEEINRQQRILESAWDDPGRLVETPNELLVRQPALRSLKDGLVAAQLRLSELMGRYSEQHPACASARTAIEDIKQQIHDELPTALRGLEAQTAIAQNRVAALQRESDDINSRLRRLADIRVDYGQLVDKFRENTETFNTAQKDLAQIQSSLLAAQNVDLVERLDQPQVGTSPLGPTRKVIVLGGAATGIALALGLLLLFDPPPSSLARRRSTHSASVPVAATLTEFAPRSGNDVEEPQQTQTVQAPAAETGSVFVVPNWPAEPPGTTA